MRVGALWNLPEGSDATAGRPTAVDGLLAAIAAAGDAWAGASAFEGAPRHGPWWEWDAVAVLSHGRACADRAACASQMARIHGVALLTNPAEAILLCAVRTHWRAVAAAAGVPVPRAVRIWDPAGRLPPMRYPVLVWDRGGAVESPPTAWNAGEVRAAAAAGVGRTGPPALAECWQPGRTFAVAVLCGQPLRVLERQGRADVPVWRCPAAVPPSMAGTLGQLARRAALALRVDGPGLMQFHWDGQRLPRLTRPDALPDLASGDPFMVAAEASGIDAEGVFAALLDHARRHLSVARRDARD